jgi:hypothetical protein
MGNRGAIVNDPQSVVLVDNISDGVICLPREGAKDILFKPGETAQITWSEFISAKNTPHFGRYIKLNDSVVIADGSVKIKNVTTALTDDSMIEMLVQSVDRLKEFCLTLNKGERKLFTNFLDTRIKLGIEKEKCEEIIAFIGKEYPEEVKKAEKKPDVEASPPKRGPGRPRKDEVIVTENKDALTAHVERVEDSE